MTSEGTGGSPTEEAARLEGGTIGQALVDAVRIARRRLDGRCPEIDLDLASLEAGLRLACGRCATRALVALVERVAGIVGPGGAPPDRLMISVEPAEGAADRAAVRLAIEPDSLAGRLAEVASDTLPAPEVEGIARVEVIHGDRPKVIRALIPIGGGE